MFLGESLLESEAEPSAFALDGDGRAEREGSNHDHKTAKGVSHVGYSAHIATCLLAVTVTLTRSNLRETGLKWLMV